MTLAATDDWPWQKEEAKNLFEPCAAAMGWAGQGDKLIWGHAGDKELEKNAKRFNKDV